MRTVWLSCFALLLAGCYGPAGADGRQGLEGVRGPAGPAGVATSGYRPAFWASCGATLDLLALGAAGATRAQDGMPETSLHYALLVYTNGDAEVQCSAQIGSAQDGSSSTYYPAPTKGAANGTCIVSADFGSTPGGEVGFWLFDVATAACPRAAYNDPDNPLGLNGFSYKYGESDCAVRMMNADGKWTQVTLSDVF